MKKASFFFALTLALAAAQQLAAQKTNTWKGNFPGQETNWNCARNWSLGTSPDWNCHVVIPALQAERKNYPVLSSKNVEIYSLVIEPGARLEIAASGALSIIGVSPYDTPVHNKGALLLQGTLETPQDRDRSVAHKN